MKSFPSSEISPKASFGKRISHRRIFSIVSLSSWPPKGDRPLRLNRRCSDGCTRSSLDYLTSHKWGHQRPTCQCRSQRHRARQFQVLRIPRLQHWLWPLRWGSVSLPDRNHRFSHWYWSSFRRWCSPASETNENKAWKHQHTDRCLTFRSKWTILFSCICRRPSQICRMYLIASGSVIL